MECEKTKITKTIQLEKAIRFNGGGHLNHALFWETLTPVNSGGGKFDKDSTIGKAILKTFGTLEDFQNEFNTKSAGVQGSGWGWLGYCPALKTIQVVTCANQDPLLATTGLIPLLGIDVWVIYMNSYIQYTSSYIEV